MPETIKEGDQVKSQARVGLYLILLKGVFNMGAKVKRPEEEGKVINNYTLKPFLICWTIFGCVFYTLMRALDKDVTGTHVVMLLFLSGVCALSLGIPIKVNIKGHS